MTLPVLFFFGSLPKKKKNEVFTKYPFCFEEGETLGKYLSDFIEIHKFNLK